MDALRSREPYSRQIRELLRYDEEFEEGRRQLERILENR